MSFKTVSRDGRIVRVKDFGWSKVLVICQQGAFAYTAQLPVSLRVVGRVFSLNALGTDLTQAVSGRFTNHRRRANGTLNVAGVLALGEMGCGRGDLTWSAARR